jgi:hypothetical protein
MRTIFKRILEVIFILIRFAKTKKCWYICGLLLSYILVGWFFSSFYLRFPILVQFQSLVVKRTVIVKKLKDAPLNVDISTIKEADTKVDDQQIIDIIVGLHILESSNGTAGLAVECKNKGMHNEVGYLVYSGFCFKDETEELLTLKNWFTKRLSTGRTVADCMCEYSSGTVGLVNCAYYQKYLAL